MRCAPDIAARLGGAPADTAKVVASAARVVEVRSGCSAGTVRA